MGTSPLSPTYPVFRPAAAHYRRRLLSVAAFGAYGLGLSGLYAVTGRGLWCPFRAATGWLCPLCGATRLGHALLEGDLAAAFGHNPAVFVALGVLLVVTPVWVVRAYRRPTHSGSTRHLAAGRCRRSVTRLRTWLGSTTPAAWLSPASVAAVGYTVLRNLG